MIQLSINQKLKIKIKKLGINGEGIANYKGRLIFIEDILPQEEATIKIIRNERNFSIGQLVKLTKKSPYRVTPPCHIYDICGGCQLMHLDYDQQLKYKTDLIFQALRKFKPKGFEKFQVRATIGQKEPMHYRNKLQFQIRQNNKSGKIEAGLYAINSHHLVNIKNCYVQSKQTQAIINTCVTLFNQFKISAYDERKRTGLLKTVMVRESALTKEIQLIFVTTRKEFPKFNELKIALVQAHPEIVTIDQNIQKKQTSKVYGEANQHLWGKRTIQEDVLKQRFELSPQAFLQLNPEQMNRLYQEALDAMTLNSEDKIIDAYCGVGTIGLSLAKRVKEVRGMDTISQAIDDAKINAKNLGINNAHYETGTAEAIIPKWEKAGFKATGLIVDPPRTGIDSKLLATIIKQPPQKMVYISCNISTLARDLVELVKVYQVEYIQSVDMFPHTARTEAVVKLTLK